MASFTDSAPQFNPYVQQLPVEAMVKVGMYKQEKYDKGIEKIQGYIDNIAGLDIYKDVHKEYLQSKLNELGNNISKVAGGDFSNYQLVNSVTGMASQIIKDPVIQNAVGSTARIRKEQETVESAKKSGTLTPDNELKWTKSLNSWANDGDLTSKFTGSYVPYFDVFKFAKETFDAVKPDEMSWDEIFQMGADGKPLKDGNGNLVYSPTMTRMKKEGRFPEKVAQTLQQIFSDPRVSQQLAITGEYDYRNYSPQDLAKKVVNQKDDIMQAYENKLVELRIDKTNGKDVQKQIDNIESALKSVEENYNNYIDMLGKDPDVVRGILYKDDVKERYTTMFGQIKTDQQIVENPAWNQEFKMQQEKNKIKMWEEEQQFNRYKFGREEYWRDKNYTLEEMKILMGGLGKGKSGGVGGATGPAGKVPTLGDMPSDTDINLAFDNDFSRAANDFAAGADEFIWKAAGYSTLPNNINFIKFWTDRGLTESQAISKALDEAAKVAKMSPEEFRVKWGNTAATKYNALSQQERDKNPMLTNLYEGYKKARRNFDDMMSINGTIEKQLALDNTIDKNALKKQQTALNAIPEKQVINYEGKIFELSRQDMSDIAQFAYGRGSAFGFLANDNARTESNNALKRLKARGLEDLAKHIVDSMRLSGGQIIKNPLTAAGSVIRRVFSPTESIAAGMGFGLVPQLVNQVVNLTDVMDESGYSQRLAKRAEIIKKTYGIKPNLNLTLMGEDAETNQNTLYNIKALAGAYKSGQSQNYSGDFSEFSASLSDDPKKNNLQAQIIKDANNNPMVEIVSYGSDGERVGGMTIQPDEALNTFGIDINSLYEPSEVSVLRNKINFNGGRTSAGDPMKKETYIQGDVYYEKNDFPSMMKSDADIKGNIVYSNGAYFPIVYISGNIKDNQGNILKKDQVRMLPGDRSLQGAINKMRDVDPTLAYKILIEK